MARGITKKLTKGDEMEIMKKKETERRRDHE